MPPERRVCPTETAVDIRPLAASPETLAALTNLLVETVANDGSVSFMHPLAIAGARAFWETALAEAAAGEKLVLGAWRGGELAGTVSLCPAWQPNQRHRAEITKLMTGMAHRGQGVARALMLEAERIAVERGLTLLSLDTATEGGAAGLYEGLGYTLAGVIPDYALTPFGSMSGTALYWKRIGAG